MKRVLFFAFTVLTTLILMGCTETYTVTVSSVGSGYSGGGSYAEYDMVTINAGNAPYGQRFKDWTVTSGGVMLANANNATTTFTMPARDVTVRANFVAAYTVTISSAGSGSSGSGSYTANTTVTIKAGNAPSGQRFKDWTVTSGGVTLANANNATTTFTMPARNVAITANFVRVFTDTRDGKIYETMTLGTKTWMAENLNYQTSSGSWCYGNLTSNCNSHGRLYDWNTAMAGSASSTTNPSRVRGVCPTGWHLPSRAEWSSALLIGNNLDGFLPGGYRNSSGSFLNGNIYGYWWTATAYTTNNAYNRYILASLAITMMEENSPKEHGFSVRCVQD